MNLYGLNLNEPWLVPPLLYLSKSNLDYIKVWFAELKWPRYLPILTSGDLRTRRALVFAVFKFVWLITGIGLEMFSKVNTF